ncbi:MAG TPA: glucose-6-phosphate dehydrogenase assembly protein OpcA [Gaiellaceae bacterium]|nr:glucose-6-phosphate dehydrogenase assembly protein OpcA [Gaiellaceae bacterium]
MSVQAPTTAGEWTGENVSVAEIERQFAELRQQSARAGVPELRTSVSSHVAWVPPEWAQKAVEALAGLEERHPSRTILLFPEERSGRDAIDAEVSLRCFTMPGLEHHVCSEVAMLRLRGRRAAAPASIVAPLLIPDLPAFLRWRGVPPFGREPFAQMLDVVDRLIVDSTEWEALPAPYAQLAESFDRVAVSDIAWARTSRWRRQLATLWPGIASVRRIHVTATPAQAHLLAGWLRSRLGRPELELEITEADTLEGVDVDGVPAPFPPGDPPAPSDLLSDELDQFGRDPIYEAAVRAAPGS